MTMKNDRDDALLPPRSGAKTLCGDAERLIDYLYNECAADERARMQLHVLTCEACAAEVAALGAAREQLAMWAPPEATLGFRVAAEPPAPVVPVRMAWWRQPMPVWGQAVAAVALFGLGMAAGGRGVDPAVRPATESAPAAVSADALAQLEARMKQEIAAMRTAAPAPAPSRASTDSSDEAILRQVRELLRESESRQGEAFAVRAAQMARDAEIQRRVDQAQMQQTLTQMQGSTSEEVRRQREMLNYLVNVSQRR